MNKAEFENDWFSLYRKRMAIAGTDSPSRIELK